MNRPLHSARVQEILGRAGAWLTRHRLATGVAICLLAIVVLVLDSASPSYIEYSVVYVILIAFATQFAAWQLGVALVLFLPIGYLVAYLVTPQPRYPLAAEAVNMTLLVFVGLGTVYLLRTLKHMEELRQANIRLETLRQTMVTVNDVVLNRLQVMQFLLHLAEQGKPLTAKQAQMGKAALDEIAASLRDLSHLTTFETTEVVEGIHAVRVPKQPNSGPADSGQSNPGDPA
ncbi:MAG: hypothetical protein U0X20_19685 [Caldilineaceae bacterium]